MVIAHAARGRAARAVLLLPAVVLMIFIGAIVYEKLATIRYNKVLAESARSINAANALIHQLQMERGRSAQVLAAGGDTYLAELRRQWRATDVRRADLQAAIDEISAPAFAASLFNIQAALSGLDGHRARIADRQADAIGSIDAYSRIIKTIQAETGGLPNLDRLAGLTAAYADLGHIKEALGQERAIGAVGFHTGRFDGGLIDRLQATIARRDAFEESFLSHADTELRRFFNETMGARSPRDMEDWARAATQPHFLAGPLTIDADHWFDIVTEQIEGVRLVEDRVAEQIDQLVAEDLHRARTTFLWALGGGVLLAGVFFWSLFRSEAGAHEARKRLAHAIDSIPEGFVLWDSSDRLVILNRRFREICRSLAPDAAAGVDACLVPGGSFETLMRTIAVGSHLEATPQATERWIQRRLAAHRQPRGPFDSRFGDNGWIRISEYRAEDGSTLGIYSDINDDKRREAALREARYAAEIANRAKTEFLANMSHEFRTPLNAIIGFSEVMKEQMLGPLNNDRYLAYAKDVHDAGQHLLGLVNDVLDVARIETGNVALAAETVDIRAVIGASTTLLRDRAQAKGLGLAARIEPEVGAVRGDARRIKQVVVNILTNAVKFTHEGSVTIRARLDENGCLSIAVVDTGIGIAEADISRVIAPFAQADSSLSRPYDGSGLGLPLSKNLMELHGGTLTIASTIGVGTTVTLRFPRERTIAAAEAAV